MKNKFLSILLLLVCISGLTRVVYAAKYQEIRLPQRYNRRPLTEDSRQYVDTASRGDFDPVVRTQKILSTQKTLSIHNNGRKLTLDNPKVGSGTPASQSKYSYIASVALYGLHACGGTLIAPRVVLTAAHCVFSIQQLEFYPLTTISLRIGNVNRSQGISRWASGVVIPDQFQPNSTAFFGDVAVILLNQPIINGTFSQLVTRYKPSDGRNSYRALGWGTDAKGMLIDTLQQVDLRGLKYDECVKLTTTFNMSGGVPADHFCAGLNSSGADTCAGDSGGPLLSGNYQAGITSYGPAGQGCYQSGANFGLYTTVAYWYTWIQDTISIYNMGGDQAPAKFNKPQLNMCYTGASTTVQTTNTMGACCEACRNSTTCDAWSWDIASKACSFKSAGSFTAVQSDKCHSGTFV